MKSCIKSEDEGFSPENGRNPAKSSQVKAQAELKRLQDLTKDAIPSTKRSVAMPLMHNLAWQKVKLDETRRELMGQSLVIEYDNGGGQSGIRENPGFTAYNKLFGTFSRGVKQLCDMMDGADEAADELADYFNETKL